MVRQRRSVNKVKRQGVPPAAGRPVTKPSYDIFLEEELTNYLNRIKLLIRRRFILTALKL